MKPVPDTAIPGGGGEVRIGLLVVHTVAVGLLGLVFAVTFYSAEEPNIGAGLIGLPLIVLGLPWSLLLAVTGAGAVLSSGLSLAVPAFVNVWLHTAIVVRRLGREHREPRRVVGAVVLLSGLFLAVQAAVTVVGEWSRSS